MAEHIGVFGGSFDPPHLGHLVAASYAQDAGEFDRLLWVPTGESYHKGGGSGTSAEHRFNMVERAVESNESFTVSDVDVRRAGPSYTFDMVTQLRQQHPGAGITLILGADALAGLASWHRADELCQLVSILGVTRADIAERQLPPAIVQQTSLRWIDIPSIGISSTYCRERVRAGLSLRYLVPNSVEEYISANALYSESHVLGV